MWWNYVKATKLPTPGAMQYGLLDNRQPVRPMIGPAIGRATIIRAFAQQNLQTTNVMNTTGLGGLAQGQIALAPLVDPYNYNEELL